MSKFRVGDIVVINRVSAHTLEYEIKNYAHLHGECGVLIDIKEGGLGQPYIVKVDVREWYVHDISLIEEENE